MVKDAKLFTVVLWKRSSEKKRKKKRKTLMQESLSRQQTKQFHAYSLKKDSYAGVFLWVLPNVSESFFFLQNTSVWLFLLNTPFFFVMSTPPSKNVSFNLGYFKYFRDKHCELLPRTALFGGPRQTVSCG